MNTNKFFCQNPSFAAEPLFAGGDGTPENPYQIATLEQLTTFREMVCAGNTVIFAKAGTVSADGYVGRGIGTVDTCYNRGVVSATCTVENAFVFAGGIAGQVSNSSRNMYNYNDVSGNLSAFPDGNNVAAYARDAMAWANGAGLITGTREGNQTLLDPRGAATRAQIATILMRYCKNTAQ